MEKKTKPPTYSHKNLAQQLQDKIDFFGSSVNFNIGGRDKVTSLPGCILSIALGITFLAYSVMKF